MASELIKGETLDKELTSRGRYPFNEACQMMYQLCEAVAYAHSHLVVHRDIKPQNIYLTPDGLVKLGDFGIAFFENGRRVTKSDAIVGSVHYMAPEVSQGKTPTFQSDVYSLGITFFELVTGKVPFDGPSGIAIALMHVKERFPSPRKVLPTIPKAIEEIILKACRKYPTERYRTVTEMQKAIKQLIDNPNLTKPKVSFFAKLLGFKMDD
jgi:serine/threonine-protein kinase